MIRTQSKGRPAAASVLLAAAMLAGGAARASLLHVDGFENPDAALLDERLVRSMIHGMPPTAGQVAALLQSVGNRGGFPVATTADTFLFVAHCDGESWSLAGDFTGWDPVPMHRHGAMCWSERAVIPALEQGYLFVRPDTMRIPDPHARRYIYQEGDELSLVRSAQQRIERGFGFGPQVGLLPRTVRVLVPADDLYDRAIYMQDGEQLFDPQALFGGWSLQQEPRTGVLIVGIDSTADRLAEYTHTPDDLGSGSPAGGDGDRYAELVHAWIRPWIERRYSGITRSGVLGASLGGLVSLHIADRYPGTYDFAGSLSGSLGWGRIGALGNETLIERYAASGRRDTVIYLDSGGSAAACADLDGDGIRDDAVNSDNFCVTQQMRDTLLGLGYVIDVDLIYRHDPGAVGNPSAWGARVYLPLQRFADL